MMSAESEKSPEREGSHKQLLKALESVKVGLFFLADDRKITSNVLRETADSEQLEDTEFVIDVTGHYRTLHGDLATRKRKVADKVLEDAITRVTSWATTTALKASTQGEEDVNTIYSRILQQLAKPVGAPGGHSACRYSSVSLADAISKKLGVFGIWPCLPTTN